MEPRGNEGTSSKAPRTEVLVPEESHIDQCPFCHVDLETASVAHGLVVCASCGQLLPEGTAASRLSGKAQMSLMLGILSLGLSVLTALPSIFLGWSALREMKRRPRELRGKGFAIGGILLSLLMTFATAALLISSMGGLRFLEGYVGSNQILVPDNSEWTWLHPATGRDPGRDQPDFHTSFYRLDFDDASWERGTDRNGTRGGFGYGDAVAVDIGKPQSGKRKAAYFRHRFSTEGSFTNLSISLRRDDGVIVYLDGAEVARNNMQPGADSYELMAAESINGNRESGVLTMPISGTLEIGEHILAISVHNHSGTSSDLRLAGVKLLGEPVD